MFLILFLVALTSPALTWAKIQTRQIDSYQNDLFSDQWVLSVDGGQDLARQVALKYGFVYLGQILDGFHHLKYVNGGQFIEHIQRKLEGDKSVTWFSRQKIRKRVKRWFTTRSNKPQFKFNDPLWPAMWYLNRGKGLDMNVQPVWAMGLTGKSIVVTILDDGLEKDHPDIEGNYDPKASYNANSVDAFDPEPRYDQMDLNRHGTRCAGQVAGMANNSVCAVGIAYEASIGGIRMLDGFVTDAIEAKSLSYNRNHIDIYSSSWGPDDDGKTVDGPGELAQRAFIDGVTYGRHGLGSIFVWASGNGGRKKDNCNCDGYTNSIWTLSISSVSENGLAPWYSEPCSSTIASTYSSGTLGEKQVVTTDLHHSCTGAHTGTSASAPIAAGICALVLQANPRLSWRDMQHIVIRTSRPGVLIAPDWSSNGVGRQVSHLFGYGLMDAFAMVTLARHWTRVPDHRLCKLKWTPAYLFQDVNGDHVARLKVSCPDVRYLEHVQSILTLKCPRRGDVSIRLVSPMGTESVLLTFRPLDDSRAGFYRWPFMTVHVWGENPNGEWTLRITNKDDAGGRVRLDEWVLMMYGTCQSPNGEDDQFGWD